MSASGAFWYNGVAAQVLAGGGTTVTPGAGQATWAGVAPSITGTTTTITPGAGQATWTGVAPTIQIAVVVAPGIGQATWTGLAPTVTVTNNQTVSPGTGQAIWSGVAPTVTGPASIATPAVGGRPRVHQLPTRRAPVYPQDRHPQYLHLPEDVHLTPGTAKLVWRSRRPVVEISQYEEEERMMLQMASDDEDLALALSLVELV